MHDDLLPVFERVQALFETEDFQGAADLLAGLSPSETADLFRSLQRDEKIAIVRRLPAEYAASVLVEVDDRSLPELFDLLQDEEIVEMVDTMDSDDAADIVGQLEDEHADRVIQMLDEVDHEDALELGELLAYPDDSAGGIMAKEYLSSPDGETVGNVIQSVREMEERDFESLHYCFVVDARGRLVGQIQLLKLLLADPRLAIREIMETEPLTVDVMVDQEEVAHLFGREDLLSLPVVDQGQRLVGRITVDDIMDVLSEEATEDVARLAGSSAEEVGETSVFRISKARLPWLLMGLGGQMLAALVLSQFEESLRTRVILTFFIPMVMATGGNIGIQTSTIIIRQLVTQKFDTFRAYRHLMREILVGMLNGLLIGGVVLLALYAWKQDLEVGIIIGISLLVIVLMAAIIGSLVPLVLDRLNIDPTVATGPFITTLNDVLGILAYLGLAHWLLSVL